MHRTEADGNDSNLYVDQDLPLVEGTIVAASDRNAVQEEIANVIERAGLTLQTEATDTRDQLEEVIFDTALRRTAAIFVKSSAGSPYELLMNEGLIEFSDTADDSTLALNAGSGSGGSAVVVTNLTTGVTTTLGAQGAYITDGSTSTQLTSDQLLFSGQGFRTKRFAWTGTWSVDAGTGRVWYSNPSLVLTGVPWDSVIYSAALAYKDSGGKACSAPVFLRSSTTSGTFTVTSAILMADADPDGGSGHTLMLTYDPTGGL